MTDNFIRFIDSNTYTVYKTIQDNINTFSYHVNAFTKTDHPFHGYCYKSLETLEDELNISRKVISENMKVLQNLGFIKISRYRDMEKELTNKIAIFKSKIPLINAYSTQVETFQKINADMVDFTFHPDKMFIELQPTNIDKIFMDFILKFLKEVRIQLRKTYKSKNIPDDFYYFCLSPVFEKAYLAGFDNFKDLVLKNLDRCFLKDFDFSAIERYYDLMNNKVTRVNFTFNRDFEKSKQKIKENIRHLSELNIRGRVFKKPENDFKEIINYLCYEYGLSVLAQSIKPSEDVFYMLMEICLLDVDKAAVVSAWYMFKEKYVDWKHMTLLHLIRSLRLFVYYLINTDNETKVEEENKPTVPYVIEKREEYEKIAIPVFFKGIPEYEEVMKNKFFLSKKIVDTKTEREIFPFFLYPDYLCRQDAYLPPWEEIIVKAGVEHVPELKRLYGAVKPLIRDFIDTCISDNSLKKNLLKGE